MNKKEKQREKEHIDLIHRIIDSETKEKIEEEKKIWHELDRLRKVLFQLDNKEVTNILPLKVLKAFNTLSLTLYDAQKELTFECSCDSCPHLSHEREWEGKSL